MKIKLSPHKGPFSCSIALAFDYETSALSEPSKVKGGFHSKVIDVLNRLMKGDKDMSNIYGDGYNTRFGVSNISKVIKSFGVQATWFATGHALLKDNKNNDAYRLNKTLQYVNSDAGFARSTLWRSKEATFANEPNGSYKNFPFYFFGDQSSKLLKMKDDIQCHSFSHAFMAVESDENFRMDIEDWQSVAEKNGFNRAKVYAFPYAGDSFRNYTNFGLLALPRVEMVDEESRLEMLSKKKLQILKENGIELVTRCGSKVKDKPLTGFAKYEESDVYYMSDRFVRLNNFKFDQFRREIKELIGWRSTVNLWMHPGEAYSDSGKRSFKILINYLMKKFGGGQVWLSTVEEIWEHYKRVIKVDMNVEELDDGVFKVTVKNNYPSYIDGLSFQMDQDVEIVDDNSLNVEAFYSKVVIDRMEEDQTVTFKVRAKG